MPRKVQRGTQYFPKNSKNDTYLHENLRAAVNEDAGAAIAKEAEFSISANDLMRSESSKLLHKELKFVSGEKFVRALSFRLILGAQRAVVLLDLIGRSCVVLREV